MTAEARLQELDITLPALPAPAGLYAPAVRAGSLLVVSGQVPLKDGQPMARGKLGDNVSIEEGMALARQCALQALAIVRDQAQSLDRVAAVVRTAGYVASATGFNDQSRVINGASQLLIDIFGEAGRGARIAIGVAELPLGVPVEVEFVFELRP
ncbi:MAG: RidA family protein [Tepidiformaceae bacterium]